MVELLVGFILGVFGNMVIIYGQYRGSIAHYRVSQVVEVTRKVIDGAGIDAYTRDRYRFSLAVTIDIIKGIQKDGTNGDGTWPLLVPSSGDRWEHYSMFVRPVINDIDSFVFLGARPYRWILPSLKQLHMLAALCEQLDSTVGVLDSGFEEPSVLTIKDGDLAAIKAADDERVRAVRTRIKTLPKHGMIGEDPLDKIVLGQRSLELEAGSDARGLIR